MCNLLRTPNSCSTRWLTTLCQSRSAIWAENKRNSWSNSSVTNILSLISSTEDRTMDGSSKTSIPGVTKKVRPCASSRLKTATALEGTLLDNGNQMIDMLKTTTPSSSIYQKNVTSPLTNIITITYTTTHTLVQFLREISGNLVYINLLMEKTRVFHLQIKLVTRLVSTKMETTC